ncbi:hypothetical protein ACFO5K_02675 [Nocardia halotolerans]|uniref:Uncharacterized protein n=1 Tax=Nocardia halotolerans TaxID=1755878 RepID=A0ABV8VE44_9NOCA
MLKLRFLGNGGSGTGECPALYATDQDTYAVQGWTTSRTDTVEIPHLLLGFAEPDTYVGAQLADTGRGTFTLMGRPVTDPETLAQVTKLADNESVIEVPKNARRFYGNAAAAQ